MATRTISVLGGNYNDVAAWAEAAVPTAADDVVATALSGNLTINVTSACRSFDMTGYVGVLAHSNGCALNIGDGTAGAGNVALKFVSGMTYTLGGTDTTLAFKSTSATQQTVTTAGKTLSGTSGQVVFNGVGGSWILSDNLTSTGTVSVSNGAFSGNGKTINCASFLSTFSSVRTVNIDSATINVSGQSGFPWNFGTTTNLTFIASGSTINLTGASVSNKTFHGGGLTYGTVSVTTGGAGLQTFTGSNTFAALTQAGGAAQTIRFTAGTTTTLTGTTFFQGASGNVITVKSDVDTSAWTLSKASGTLSTDYLSIQDSTASGGATFYAGSNSTNVSGNTGWTFTAVPTPSYVDLLLMGVG